MSTPIIAPLPSKPAARTEPAYKRVLLKLSGEALMGDDAYGINREVIDRIVAEIGEVVRLGVQIAVVIGGGNIFRGVAPGAAGMDRATADYMGMLATLMNALALQDAMRRAGLVSRVQSALSIEQVAEPYIRGKALRYLEENKIVIFAAGTGNPFFTTDTAAALRGREMGVDIVLKATKVDGVYTADPKKDPSAKRYRSLTFDEAMVKNLKVMDATALALCRDQNMLLKVFSIFSPGALTARGHGRGRGHAGALLDRCVCIRAVYLVERPDGFGPTCAGADMIADVKKSAEQKMQKSVEALKVDLSKVRTGRAHTGLLDHIKVDYYGSMMPISQVANVTLADAHYDRRSTLGKEDGAGGREGAARLDLGINPRLRVT